MNPIEASLRITALLKGFVILNVLLSPLTVVLTLFIGIMGGGAPHSPGALYSFSIAAAFIYLVPFGVLLLHLVIAKIVDTVCFIVPAFEMRSSWIGIGVAALALVILGNVFVDNLYQWRQGNYGLSVIAFAADLVGMGLVAGAGMIPIPFIDRRIGLSGRQ